MGQGGAMDAELAIQIARALIKAGAVTVNFENPVKYVSGILSPVYTDCRRVQGVPSSREVIVTALVRKLRRNLDFDAIAGVQNAAIPHSAVVANALGVPHFSVRTKLKDHGKPVWIEGGDPRGMRVKVIEDVLTSGKSTLDAIARLEEAGATVTGAIGILSYNPVPVMDKFRARGLTCEILTTLGNVLAAMKQMGILSAADADEVKTWHANQQGWFADYTARQAMAAEAAIAAATESATAT